MRSRCMQHRPFTHSYESREEHSKRDQRERTITKSDRTRARGHYSATDVEKVRSFVVCSRGITDFRLLWCFRPPAVGLSILDARWRCCRCCAFSLQCTVVCRCRRCWSSASSDASCSCHQLSNSGAEILRQGHVGSQCDREVSDSMHLQAKKRAKKRRALRRSLSVVARLHLLFSDPGNQVDGVAVATLAATLHISEAEIR